MRIKSLDIWIDFKSIYKSLREIKRPYYEPAPRWSYQYRSVWPWKFWVHCWTPVWHRGRGPYLTLGLGKLAIYRGY